MNNKYSKFWFYIVVLSTIGAVAVVLSLNPREVRFNAFELSRVNGVVNGVDSLPYLDSIAKVALDVLAIEGVSLVIRPIVEQPEVEEGLDVLAFIVSGTPQQFMMFIKPTINRYQAIEIISHEIIHLQQYHTRELIKVGVAVQWQGRVIEDIRVIPYFERPWEVQAFYNGEVLSKVLKKLLIKE